MYVCMYMCVCIYIYIYIYIYLYCAYISVGGPPRPKNARAIFFLSQSSSAAANSEATFGHQVTIEISNR